VETLADQFQEWRDNLSASLADSAIADRLDEPLHPFAIWWILATAELPRGFGRD